VALGAAACRCAADRIIKLRPDPRSHVTRTKSTSRLAGATFPFGKGI
jgi:hypothetical protein